MTKEEFESIIKPLTLLSKHDKVFITGALLGNFINWKKKKQLSTPRVSKRYDSNKHTPPFRVGRKQGKAVLDGKGIEVVFFMHSEEQAKMYCDYLNTLVRYSNKI